jgi:enoyl-CoA hydratase/carnithine racemase
MNHKILPTMVMSALVGRVAEKQMQYLVFTRVTIAAERALALNIINESVPAASLEARLGEVLADLSVVPKAALLGVKEYARSAYDMPARGALDFARNLHATVNSSVSELRA